MIVVAAFESVSTMSQYIKNLPCRSAADPTPIHKQTSREPIRLLSQRRTASLLRDEAGFNHVTLANRGTSTACADGRSAFPDRTADPRVRA